jgi:hypothetical protein
MGLMTAIFPQRVWANCFLECSFASCVGSEKARGCTRMHLTFSPGEHHSPSSTILWSTPVISRTHILLVDGEVYSTATIPEGPEF